MILATSKITAQGQLTLPAAVRKRLGIAPGERLIWDEEGGRIVVRRRPGCTFQDIHERLFAGLPPPKPLPDVKEAIAAHIREKHARD